jgi:hypothetical protein
MFNSMTTRMPNGVTNAASWQTMGQSGVPDPTWGHVYSNDFDTFSAGDWTISNTGVTPTNALSAVDGGALLTTTTAGIADASYLQLATASFKLIPGKAAFFKWAGQISDIANSVFHAGLIMTSSTPLTANDGVYLVKATAQGGLVLRSVVGGVTTSVALPITSAIIAATYFEIGIEVDYLGNVAAYFNPTTGSNPISASAAAAGQSRGRVAMLATPGVTQALLAPSFGLLNSTAAARTMTTDFITAVRER